jgi:acyl dehydratase
MSTDSTVRDVKVPLTLALQQAPMLRLLGRIAMSTVLPARSPERNPEVFVPAHVEIPAPSAKLVSCYTAWCGAGDRYKNMLPPHMFSQWALPVAAEIIGQSRYRIAGIINQGVTMRINGELPRGVPLLVSAKLASLEEKDGRARLSVELTNGTAQQPDAIIGTLHTTFILSKVKKDAVKKEGPEPRWSTVGTWRAAADDGLKFALLTGDFNPIHWIGIAGKLSPFGRKVLHGFGMFVRSYEVLANKNQIGEIDVRFIKPVPLPSGTLHVQQTAKENDGGRQVRLAGDKDVVHMAGRYR